MSQKDQIDVSHFDQPLAALAQEVEALHLRLDNFASGKTDQLVGYQTRYALRDALEGVDEAMAELRHRRAKAAPRLRGRVTAAMRDKLSRANELVEKITRANRRILEDSSEQRFDKLSHLHLSYLVGDLGMILTRFDHEMTTSGLTADETHPTHGKAALWPAFSGRLWKVFALVNSGRRLRFLVWQNRVSR